MVWYVDFCRLVPQGTETPCVISGVSLPIFTRIAQNVAKIVPFNTCKSKPRYSNPMRNAIVEKKSFRKFCPKSVAMATSLKELKKEARIEKIHANTFHLRKDRENRSSRSWDNLAQVKKKKKCTQAKYIARSASLPSGLNVCFFYVRDNLSHAHSQVFHCWYAFTNTGHFRRCQFFCTVK